MSEKPLTATLLTGFLLWALWLWRRKRLERGEIVGAFDPAAVRAGEIGLDNLPLGVPAPFAADRRIGEVSP